MSKLYRIERNGTKWGISPEYRVVRIATGRTVYECATRGAAENWLADNEPVVRDPESWQAVAREGRRFA